MNGKPLYEIGILFDSMMTFYKRFNIVDSSGYAQLSLFVDSVLQPVNEAFMKDIDSNNFQITMDTTSIKKNPYAVRLLGVKSASETGFLKQVLKTSVQSDYSTVNEQPNSFELYQNYPNPFNPTTTIRFQIPENSFVTMKIYNILGQELQTLMNKVELSQGQHEVEFDASRYSSGVYFYRVVTETNQHHFVSIKKMMLVK